MDIEELNVHVTASRRHVLNVHVYPKLSETIRTSKPRVGTLTRQMISCRISETVSGRNHLNCQTTCTLSEYIFYRIKV